MQRITAFAAFAAFAIVAGLATLASAQQTITFDNEAVGPAHSFVEGDFTVTVVFSSAGRYEAIGNPGIAATVADDSFRALELKVRATDGSAFVLQSFDVSTSGDAEMYVNDPTEANPPVFASSGSGWSTRAVTQGPTTELRFTFLFEDQSPGNDVSLDNIVLTPYVSGATITNVTQNTTYPLLNTAVIAAQPGDVIEVGEGVTTASSVIVEKPLTIRGQGADKTFLDGQFLNTYAMLGCRPGADLLLEDVCVRHSGGGGGGGLVTGSVFCEQSASCEIRDCVFEDHRKSAVFADINGAIRVVGATFRGDTEGSVLAGAVASRLGGEVELLNCAFEGGRPGGDTIATFGGTISVTNGTFVGRTDGRYLHTQDGGMVQATNCVFDGGTDVGNGTKTRCVYPGATGDNLDGVPQFLSVDTGDYRLAGGSLGVDYADQTAYVAAGGGAADLLGLDRFVDDPETSNTGLGTPAYLDAGAYEYQGTPVIQQPFSAVASVGDPPVEFTFLVNGAVSYQWFKDGVALTEGSPYTGVQSSTLSVEPSEVSEGLYFCQALGDMMGHNSTIVGLAVRPNACTADLAAPFGQLNFDDVIAFLTAFGAGCP
ncbi:MAG: hypothetical protein R3B57_00230 [Phycisphaerales bacterium]